VYTGISLEVIVYGCGSGVAGWGRGRGTGECGTRWLRSIWGAGSRSECCRPYPERERTMNDEGWTMAMNTEAQGSALELIVYGLRLRVARGRLGATTERER
jgi:hypothetical protein